MNGWITDIQRFSLGDGPGIRTTVFFMGCNLACKWCHNPETLPMKPMLLHYPVKCIGCGRCFQACASGVHKAVNGKHIIDRMLCKRCGKCSSLCYAGALPFNGRKATVEEIMAEVRQDRIYYEESGGGVTFSGGEVLCQNDFLCDVADACHSEGYHVTLETNLYAPFETVMEVSKHVDLIMMDIKIFDSEEHRQWTGAHNEQILKNAKGLSASGIPLIIRTPLIPGATDKNSNIAAIADFVSGLSGVDYYELLNFNPLGASKYESLGKENQFESARPLPKSRLDELSAIARSYGIKVKVS